MIRSRFAWCVAAGLLLTACTSGTSGTTPSSQPPVTTSPTTSAPPRATTTFDEPSPTATTQTSTAPTRPPGRFTLAFAGDVHFADVVGQRLANDPATVFGVAAPGLRKADLTMVNLETAVTSGGDQQNKEFTFRAPPIALQALRDAGIDVATMANNHGADYGTSGLLDSLAASAKYHFPIIGIGKDAAAAFAPYTATIAGTKVAIIAADQVEDETTLPLFSAGAHKPGVANAYSDQLLTAVRTARAAGYLVVVYLHWGIEFHTCPSSDQESLAGKLADAGAAAVVGTHAHVLQGDGWLPDGTFVDYGLGNFLWWRTFGNQQDDNGVLTLSFAGGKVVHSQFAPSHLTTSGVPVPATGSDRTRILDELSNDRSCTNLSATP